MAIRPADCAARRGKATAEPAAHGCVARPLCAGEALGSRNRKRTTGERFYSSNPVWWAWLDLNQRPHPYQAYSRDAFLLVRRSRPARRWRRCDRGCPLGTGIDRPMWHANGTTGEERPGAGGEVEALRPPHVLCCSQGLPDRHHLPKVGRPTPLFLPGRIAEPAPAPGRDSRVYAGSQEGGRLPYLPWYGVTEAGPGR